MYDEVKRTLTKDGQVRKDTWTQDLHAAKRTEFLLEACKVIENEDHY